MASWGADHVAFRSKGRIAGENLAIIIRNFETNATFVARLVSGYAQRPTMVLIATLWTFTM